MGGAGGGGARQEGAVIGGCPNPHRYVFSGYGMAKRRLVWSGRAAPREEGGALCTACNIVKPTGVQNQVTSSNFQWHR